MSTPRLVPQLTTTFIYKDSKSKGFCIFLIFIRTLHRALLLVLSPISALIFVQDPFRQCFDTANAFMLIHLFPFR